MEISNIKHEKIPFKNSELLDIMSTVTGSAYTLGSGLGYDLSDVRMSIAYILSVIGKTGSTILAKWEQQAEKDINKIEGEF